MSALFDNKRCVICNKYICQIPRYRDAHVAFHIRRGEAEITYIDHRQFFVATEKQSGQPRNELTALTADAENEPLHNAEDTGSLRG